MKRSKKYLLTILSLYAKKTIYWVYIMHLNNLSTNEFFLTISKGNEVVDALDGRRFNMIEDNACKAYFNL